MTFKHNSDFLSSPTMRSLERYALEKGLVKPEVITKQANRESPNFIPTNNLMENIFKLCSGMKTRGLHKEAVELETNFLYYKQAQTMYNTHNETGEDLIHSAHPGGSHKLEDLSSDEATVEDLLDQHAKILTVMDKQPTGKLSSAQIINRVKMIFAQEVDVKQLNIAGNDKIQEIKNKIDQIFNLAEPEVNSFLTSFSQWKTAIYGNLHNTLDNLKKLKTLLSQLHFRLRPGVIEGITEDTWSQIEGLFPECYELIDQAITMRTQSLNATKQHVPQRGDFQVGTIEPVYDPLINKGNNLIERLQSFTSIKSIIQNPRALQWIPQEIAEIKDVIKRFTNLPASQIATMRGNLETEMNEKETEVNDFATKMVHTA